MIGGLEPFGDEIFDPKAFQTHPPFCDGDPLTNLITKRFQILQCGGVSFIVVHILCSATLPTFGTFCLGRSGC